MMLAPLLLLMPATAPDFDTEVVPVLTRYGCNSGACHGSAAGRGGFKLSLWGSDPAGDYDALTRAVEGRRVNLAKPARSLLLRKPTGDLKHGGGRRLAPDGDGARRLRAWVEGGAGRPPRRTLKTLTVTPAETLLERVGQSAALRAEAQFSDGSKVDVTAWAVFSADDPASIDADSSGKVTALRRGMSTVIVRFLDRVVPVRIVVPVGAKAIDLRHADRHNFIDDEIVTVLERLRLKPAGTCDDATFLRRVSLDLTGTLPGPGEVHEFLRDGRPDRRGRLVERLLASHAFVDYWTMQWAALLRIQSRSLGSDGAKRYHGWLREQIAGRMPLDWMARTLLTAQGDTRRLPAANFARVAGDARAEAEEVGRVFLGVRLQCANCHNHPLDRWTQDDYHGLAAVFARLERGVVVRLAAKGEVIHPRTGEPAWPRLPGERFLKTTGDPREPLAAWLVSPRNPLFARAQANRVWKALMGRGLVEPVDDLRETNPATHPRLLQLLADDLARHDFDLRSVLRLIVNSAAYQRAGREAGQPVDERFYSHAIVRPLPPEVLADAIVEVTGVPDRHGDLPTGTRAITLFDSLIPSPSLDVLGRCSRAGPCESDTNSAGLARTLDLINGPLLNAKIGSPQGRLRQLLRADLSPQVVVEECYLRALGRKPTEKERAFWKDRATGPHELEDFLWALLTCREFTTNH
jgi:hypothetical protein